MRRNSYVNALRFMHFSPRARSTRFDPINSRGKWSTQEHAAAPTHRGCKHGSGLTIVDIMTMTKVRATIKVNDGLVTSFSWMAWRAFAFFLRSRTRSSAFLFRSLSRLSLSFSLSLFSFSLSLPLFLCHHAVRRSLNSRRNGISIRGTSRGKCSEY